MDIVVKDANIIIDLFNIGLVNSCCRMKMEFHTTLHVFREISDDEQRKQLIEMINNQELIVDEFSDTEYERFLQMAGTSDGKNHLSEADCSVIILAQRYKCRLLTSDKKLKRQAEEQGLTVNGILWIMDLIVQEGIITKRDMIPYLERYRDTNERAPLHEINKRIEMFAIEIGDKRYIQR